MKYNKLVRDKIPEYIKSKGGKPVFRIASADEHWNGLKEKLREEVEEFIKSESIEEMADIWEVIEAVVEYKKFDHQDINTVKLAKVEERGGFKKGIILEEA
ncbi:MAG: nucleoside triphosphate pyrophosphohydrolase [Candidatus Yanofskybacteria bacterium]|nr:nucleoside triphosphate pyrophosphohydrolase [Candidatus Yanofskybacteria bacterium]